MLNLRKMCVEHGFQGAGGKYFRILGDGILQGVFECHKSYIDPSSLEYSEQHRKAKRIMVGMWSLYSKLEECVFVREDCWGHFGLSNFVDRRWNSDPFMGNQYERQLMADVVLPRLDEIRTQDQFVDTAVHFATLEYGRLIPQQIGLFGAFMKCGRKKEAVQRVEAWFTHLWLPRLEDYKGTLTVEELAEYFSNQPMELEKSQELACMWGLSLIVTQDEIDAYLQENYKTNMERALRANIPVLK